MRYNLVHNRQWLDLQIYRFTDLQLDTQHNSDKVYRIKKQSGSSQSVPLVNVQILHQQELSHHGHFCRTA